MNGIEKITARIEQDAKAEIEALLREAEEKAAVIRGNYEAQAKAQDEKAGAAGKAAAAQRYERLEGAAEMEARKMILAAKQEIIDKAFAKAQETLLGMDEEAYVELLAKMAVKASKTGREEIILNGRDREKVGYKVVSRANALLAQAAAPDILPELKETKAGSIIAKMVTGANALLQGTAMLTLADEVREMEGGLILRDGKVEINCAFETQLRILRETMAADVARILFP